MSKLDLSFGQSSVLWPTFIVSIGMETFDREKLVDVLIFRLHRSCVLSMAMSKLTDFS